MLAFTRHCWIRTLGLLIQNILGLFQKCIIIIVTIVFTQSTVSFAPRLRYLLTLKEWCAGNKLSVLLPFLIWRRGRFTWVQICLPMLVSLLSCLGDAVFEDDVLCTPSVWNIARTLQTPLWSLINIAWIEFLLIPRLLSLWLRYLSTVNLLPHQDLCFFLRLFGEIVFPVYLKLSVQSFKLLLWFNRLLDRALAVPYHFVHSDVFLIY